MILRSDERQALTQVLRLTNIDKKRFALAVLFGTLGLGSAIALAAVSGWLIARASEMPYVLELSVAATSVRMFGVGKALFRYLERIASHHVALEGMTWLRTNVYAKLADAPTSHVSSLRRGDILARTGRDVDSVGDVYVKAILPACVAALTAVVSVGILFWLSPAIGIALVVFLCLSAFLSPLLAGRGARRAQEAHSADQVELAAVSLTMLEGADELRVSGRLPEMQAELARLEQQIRQHRDEAARPTAWAQCVDLACLAGMVIAALLIGIPQVTSGTLTGVELAVCVLTPLAAFEGTAALGPAAVALVRGGASARRITDLLAETDTEQLATITDLEPVIEARDLVVGWPGGPEVIGPINLRITPGDTLAIVGASGIGKSTLVATLAGLIPPKSGTATIGGVAAHTLSRESVSSVLSLTAEDAHIFHTTVLENLRVARGDVTEDEAWDALRRAGLESWVSGLDHGLHHILGSDGTTVSGGERRRLLLARAFVSQSPILALDEPAEHLDPATADELTNDLLTSGLGMILVTHRVSSLEHADDIIVLGTDERGSHETLVAHSESYRWALAQEEE